EAPTQQAPAPTPAFVRRPAAPGPLPTFALNPGGSRLPRGPTYFSRRGYRRSFPTNPWFRPVVGVATAVAVGEEHACALLEAGPGRLICWGNNDALQLGSRPGETERWHPPQPLPQ